MTQNSYDAFISYRRSDGRAAAQWLRRSLEGYSAPKALSLAHGRRLKIYLDTAYERATNDFYLETIRPALLAARHLIVLITPDAVRKREGEDWILREIADFSAGPSGRNILAALAKGEMGGALPGSLQERFPHIEIVDLRGAGQWSSLNPLLAARLSAETLKLVAPLLDIEPANMPLLRREDQRRQEARLGAAAGGATAVLTAVAGLSLYAIQSQWRAERALQASLAATGYSAQQIAERLPLTGKDGETRAELLNQACDLIDQLEAEGFGKAESEARAACEIERARGHESQKEFAEAQAILERAISQAGSAFANDPQQETFLALSDARSALVEFHIRQSREDQALLGLESLLQDLSTLERAGGLDLPAIRVKARALSRILELGRAGLSAAKRAERIRQKAEAYGDIVDRILMPGSAVEAERLDADSALEISEAAIALTDSADLPKARQAIGAAIRLRTKEWRTDVAADALEAGRLYAIQAAILSGEPGPETALAEANARRWLTAAASYARASAEERAEAQRLLGLVPEDRMSTPGRAP